MKSFGTLDDAIKNAAVEVLSSDTTRTVQNLSVNDGNITAKTEAEKAKDQKIGLALLQQ